ncbi:MAG TPA: adenosylcobinamide-GDP ribazoletransferase [Methylomirabilota bacterium]|nr:adenosylcobinamide-GDP ribazoletransferase [Methylomirabilota bacterium]
MSGLATAVRYLTILPWPARAGVPSAALGGAAGWFPVVGAALGALLALIDHGLARIFPGLLSALLTVTVWKVFTGGLHLDGLADCLDALGGRTREHRLAILRDSRIGTFGAIGLILFLMIEIVALAGLEPALRWRALLAAPALGRGVAPILARVFPPARPDGQGAAFAASLGWAGAGSALALAWVVPVLTLGAAGASAALLAVVAALALGRFLTYRFGGLTGDVLGAVIELAELTVILVVAGWPVARH